MEHHRSRCNESRSSEPRRNEMASELAALLQARCQGQTLEARPAWHPYPLRVIDCALAVHLNTDRVTLHGSAYRDGVAAHVAHVQAAHPAVRTLTDLRDLMASQPPAGPRARGVLAGVPPQRIAVVRRLTDHLLREQQVYSDAPDEATRLNAWAQFAIGDEAPLYKGDPVIFRSASFRYLRFLFGAPVLVGGPHLRCLVRNVFGEQARSIDATALVGEAAAMASLPLLDVDRILREDRAQGRGWRGFVEALCDLLTEYADTRQLPADRVARLHADAPCRLDGAAHAERGDAQAALAALPAHQEDLCFCLLAVRYLRALYCARLGFAFDEENEFAAAHQHTVRLIRHLRDTEPSASESLRHVLRALADASGRHIQRRYRRQP